MSGQTAEQLEQWLLKHTHMRTIVDLAQQLPHGHHLRKQAMNIVKQFYIDLKKANGGNTNALTIALRDHSNICWYTGEKLSSISADPWKMTVEHIQPRSIGGKLNGENTVLAAHWINNMLGNAPTNVKYNIKHKLSNMDLNDCSYDDKLTIYKKEVWFILKSYYLDDLKTSPWELFRRGAVDIDLSDNVYYKKAAMKKNMIYKRAKNRLDLIERLGEVAWI